MSRRCFCKRVNVRSVWKFYLLNVCLYYKLNDLIFHNFDKLQKLSLVTRDNLILSQVLNFKRRKSRSNSTFQNLQSDLWSTLSAVRYLTLLSNLSLIRRTSSNTSLTTKNLNRTDLKIKKFAQTKFFFDKVKCHGKSRKCCYHLFSTIF